MDNIRKFSIQDIKDVYTEESDEFFYARILALSTYPNSHKLTISPEVLKEYGKTIIGKWVVADMKDGDATTHTVKEKIVGIIPAHSEVEFVEHEDGHISMYVDAVLSKIYATEVWDMFRNDNYRNVSVEFMAIEGEEDEDGYSPIIEMDIKGITILGTFVNGSCPNAGMEVYQFSENDAIEYFEHCDYKSNLNAFAEKRKKELEEEELVSHPMNKSKESVDIGSWDADKARSDLIKEKNYKTIAKSASLDLKEGWEDRNKTSLGYMVMNLKDGEWVYNAKALASALGASRGAHGIPKNEAIEKKVISIQKKLGLYKEESMAKTEKETFAVDIGNLWCLIYDILVQKYPDKDYGSIYRIDGIYEEGSQKFAVIYKKDETKKYKLDFEIVEDEVTLSDEIVEVSLEIVEKDTVMKFSEEGDSKYRIFEEDIIMEDEEESKEEDEEMGCGADKMAKETTQTEFSLETYVDKNALLEAEDADYKEFVQNVIEKMSAEEIVKEFVSVVKERDTLLAEKTKEEKERTDKKFMSIMAEYKGKLSTENFFKLYEEGKVLKFEDLDGFVNKVKSFEEEIKEKVDDEFMRFGAPDNSTDSKPQGLWDK